MRFVLSFMITYLFCFTVYAATLSGSQPIKLYQSPNNTTTAIEQLPVNTEVKIVATNMHKGYILVQTKTGLQGWVLADAVKQNDAPLSATNDTSSMDKLKQHSKTTLKYLASKSPELVQHTQNYTNSIKDRYQRYFPSPKEDRRWFIAGALVLILGVLIGLLIGRLIWHRKTSYIR